MTTPVTVAAASNNLVKGIYAYTMSDADRSSKPLPADRPCRLADSCRSSGSCNNPLSQSPGRARHSITRISQQIAVNVCTLGIHAGRMSQVLLLLLPVAAWLALSASRTPEIPFEKHTIDSVLPKASPSPTSTTTASSTSSPAEFSGTKARSG